MITAEEIEMARRMTPQERVQRCFELFVEEKARRRRLLRDQNPDWSDWQVEKHLARQLLLEGGIRDDDAPLWSWFEARWAEREAEFVKPTVVVDGSSPAP